MLDNIPNFVLQSGRWFRKTLGTFTLGNTSTINNCDNDNTMNVRKK